MLAEILCAQYDGEEGNSPVDRATWYEVSEFIKFYHDIWSSSIILMEMKNAG